MGEQSDETIRLPPFRGRRAYIRPEWTGATPAIPQLPAGRSRHGGKHLGGRYPTDVTSQLLQIAFDEDASVRALLGEGLDCLLEAVATGPSTDRRRRADEDNDRRNARFALNENVNSAECGEGSNCIGGILA